MTSKIRKQIYIEPHQEARLKSIAQQTGISEAEVIRQAIDKHIGSATSSKPDISAWQREKVFIALVKERPTPEGKRDWQREDLYER